MNGFLFLTAEEMESLEGLPYFVFCLYIALKRHVDYATGIVGQRKRISWSLLSQELFVEQHQGFEDSGSPSRFRVTRAMEWLKKRGLVEDIGSKRLGEPIVFKLLLSQAPSSVQNKPAQNPHRTRTGYPAQEDSADFVKDTDSCETDDKKPALNPHRQKPKNPHDINSQLSVLPTDINNLPIEPPVVTIHTSKSASPSAPPPALAEQVRVVFAHWQKVMGSPTSRLDRTRKTRIEWALKTYDLESCIAAIDGCALSEWHMGKNERGQKYNDITLIFRNAEKFERFLANRQQPKPKSNATTETLQRWMGNEPIEGVIIHHAAGGS